MEINTFFDNVSSASLEDGSAIIKTLFEFSKAINKMPDDDLIAFYQALTMLKKAQPVYWFKENKLTANIIEVQKIVVQAMQNSLRSRNHGTRFFGELLDAKSRFNRALGYSLGY